MELLYDKLIKYSEADYYPCHMPGHKRNAAGRLPIQLFQTDITEIDGFDNLHHPEGILLSRQKKAAEMYGSDRCYYLINGSTGGILSAISAALPEGGHILMARNCHMSAFHAAYLRKLTISYLYPESISGYDICEAISPKQVQTALEEEPDIGAVLLVSPTYEGRIADISAIAHITHQEKLPLIVDEAHGAHLGFHESFAQNSCRLGADYIIHSVHKTLPAMTQTALLHINGGLANGRLLERYLRIYQSSSPSYVLMASIDNALRVVETDGKARFQSLADNWFKLQEDLQGCRYFKVLPDESGRQDIGKLVISVRKSGLSARQLYDMLLQDYHIQMEMAGGTYVLAMFTIGDTKEGFERLTFALRDIENRLDTMTVSVPDYPGTDWTSHEIGETLAYPLAEAWDHECREELLPACIGRRAGTFIRLFPPGIPIVVPGEVLTEKIVFQITKYLQEGLPVQGVRREKAGYFTDIFADC